MKDKKPKKKVFRSPEARARQLAGLRGVDIKKHVPELEVVIENVCDKGFLSTVSDEKRKEVLDLYTQGLPIKSIEERTGVSQTMCEQIRNHALDNDSQFRDKIRHQNIKDKIYKVVEGSADRLHELMPEMGAKDAALALGIATDKLLALERAKSPDALHQHVHVHTTTEVGNAFMEAMKPKQ